MPENDSKNNDAKPGAPESAGPRYDSLVEYPADIAPGKDKAAPLHLTAQDHDDPDDDPEDNPIDRKLHITPALPGVYLLKDRAGKVLYVGKAKSLRSRVRAYFRPAREGEAGDGRYQVRFLMTKVRDFDTLVTASEKEALILENNLIKQYKPRYNIRLKDDKSYLSAKVTRHEWPRITVTRRIVKDGGRYFGPFGSADGLRETIDVIRKVFPLRTCSDGVFKNRARPCLEYQIKRCLGPCCLPVDRAEYQKHLHAAEMLLEGRDLDLLREMREQMKDHASRLEFEDAARVRDRVRAIEKTVERQTVLHHMGIDQDVFGLYREGGSIEAIVLIVRAGKLTSTQSFSFQDLEFSDHDVLQDLLTQYYQGARAIPDEIIVPVELDDAEVRAELLSERRGRKTEVIVPQRGDKARLAEMARDNARQSFAARRDHEQTREKMLEELRTRLHLRNAPKRIECYDISNLQGSMVVGSQVTFDEGLPLKAQYRRYRIRGFEGQDDFASLYEVLGRRVHRAQKENEYPDLWVIDGGKGQLNVAIQVLRENNLAEQIDCISLAKQHVQGDRRAKEVAKSEERVFLPNRKDPIVLAKNSTALFLLVRVRDEAHRFAITYNRELRRRARMRSVLDDIDGIGPTRRRAMLRHFGSLKRIREASVEQLAEVKGINLELAAQIRRHLDAIASILDRAVADERADYQAGETESAGMEPEDVAAGNMEAAMLSEAARDPSGAAPEPDPNRERQLAAPDADAAAEGELIPDGSNSRD